MNEGLNAVTLVDGEDPTTTPYILSADLQKAAVAGFIVKTDGEPSSAWGDLTEREMLHPVYGDFPRLVPGEPIPPKPALLGDVDDVLYNDFVGDIMEETRREGVESKVLAAVCLPLFVVGMGMGLTNEDAGKYLVAGAVLVFVIGAIYCNVHTERQVVKEYKPAFARHGIEVAEVTFTSDFYTRSRSISSVRDQSKYVVFSAAGSWERVVGGREFRFIPTAGARNV